MHALPVMVGHTLSVANQIKYTVLFLQALQSIEITVIKSKETRVITFTPADILVLI